MLRLWKAAVVAAGLASCASYACSDVPSLELVTAALQLQNNARLECVFTMSVKDQPKKSGFDPARYKGVIVSDKADRIDADFPDEIRYIRTPEMLYSQAEGSTRWAKRSGLTIVDFCAKNTQKDGTTTGLIRLDEQFVDFSGSDRMESVIYPVYPRMDDLSTIWLLGWMKYANVAEEKLAIDGHACWRLDISDTGDSRAGKYQVWLDPDIGLNPRRLVALVRRQSKDDLQITVDFLDYKNISDAIWFPQKQVVSLSGTDYPVPCQTIYTAVDLRGDIDCSTDSLKPHFASGTKVTVMFGGRNEVVTIP